jgi:hypothetical protein
MLGYAIYCSPCISIDSFKERMILWEIRTLNIPMEVVGF